MLYLATMQPNQLLLYGANGYTGELIARYAVRAGLRPILAGRRKAAIAPLAQQLGLPFLVIDLADQPALREALRDVAVVIHAAGPYDVTALPMVAACLATNTHYLDLNGDIDVFDKLMQYDRPARERNIMIMPGAGFDVVPTDCLALWLKKRLPDATHLEIAFVVTGSALSRGTSITTLQKLGMPGAIRQNGKIVPEPVGKRARWIEFPERKQRFFTMSIPWGDISTAGFSTGIPNIVTYTGISRAAWRLLKAQSLFNWLLRTRLMRGIIKTIIRLRPAGPDDATRDKALSLIWARAANAGGQSVAARMRCPEAYSLTALAILLIAQKILQGDVHPGYQTPASAYGEDLVMEIPGVHREAATP